MNMMQNLKFYKTMKRLRNGLKNLKKSHYVLGLTEEQAKYNSETLLKWCEGKEYVEGIRNYANSLKEKLKN